MQRGRPFVKGDARAGRRRGSRDTVPRSGRAAVRMLLEQFGHDVELLRSALRAGLEAKPPASFPYLKLIIEQNTGQPEQQVAVVTKIVNEIHTA